MTLLAPNQSLLLFAVFASAALVSCGARIAGDGATAGSADASPGSAPPATSESVPYVDARGQSAIALDAENIYWITTEDDGAVMKLPFAGGAPVVLAQHQSWARAIAVTAGSVVWTTKTTGTGAGERAGSLRSVPKSGGSVSDLARCNCAGVASDHDVLYWTDLGATDDAPSGVVWRKEGGVDSRLADRRDHPIAIAARDGRVVWANSGVDTIGTHRAGTIESIDLSAGAGSAVVVATAMRNPIAIALMGSRVVWIDANSFSNTQVSNDDGGVFACDVGGGPVAVLANHQATPVALATDDRFVYWANQGHWDSGDWGYGEVRRASFDGSPSLILEGRQAQPRAVAADATRVVWSDEGDGTLHVRVD